MQNMNSLNFFLASYLVLVNLFLSLGNNVYIRKIRNDSLNGVEHGCVHRSQYFVTKNVQFPMW
jgi:hypothetical protein